MKFNVTDNIGGVQPIQKFAVLVQNAVGEEYAGYTPLIATQTISTARVAFLLFILGLIT
jgi:hypothetical protein